MLALQQKFWMYNQAGRQGSRHLVAVCSAAARHPCAAHLLMQLVDALAGVQHPPGVVLQALERLPHLAPDTHSTPPRSHAH